MKLALRFSALLLALSSCSISFDSPQPLKLDLELLSGSWSGSSQGARFLSPEIDTVYVEVRQDSDTGSVLYAAPLSVTSSKSGGGFSTKASGAIPGIKLGQKFVVTAEIRVTDNGVTTVTSRGTSGVLTAAMGMAVSVTLLPTGENTNLQDLDLNSSNPVDLSAHETAYLWFSSSAPMVKLSWDNQTYPDLLYQVRDNKGRIVPTTSTTTTTPPLIQIQFQLADTGTYYVLIYNNSATEPQVDFSLDEAAETMVAVSADGKSYRSGNGTSWSAAVATGLDAATDIVFTNGLFVAAGQSGGHYAFATSSEGLTWTVWVPSLAPASSQVLHLAVNTSGGLLANGLRSNGDYDMLSSSDGVNWNAVGSIVGFVPGTGPAWRSSSSSWFISNKVTGEDLMLTSSTGSSWTLPSYFAGEFSNATTLFSFSNVIVLAGGDSATNQKTVTVQTGSTWGDLIALGPTNGASFTDVARNNTTLSGRLLLVGTGSSDQVYWSDDSGANWTAAQQIPTTSSVTTAADTVNGFVIGTAGGAVLYSSEGDDFEAKALKSLGSSPIKGIVSDLGV